MSAFVVVWLAASSSALLGSRVEALSASPSSSSGQKPTKAKASNPAKRRLEANVPGPLFVDASCIDCDTCRWMAPDIFDAHGGKSRVFSQPTDGAAWAAALQAAAACPVGSIRSETPRVEAKAARDAFPIPIDAERIPNVFHAGYHSEKSFGAAPYVVALPNERGCVLVDSPRYNSGLAKAIEARFGAPKLMLLTHIDDVADHARWRERFPEMRRVLHGLEVRGPDRWPYIDTTDVEVQLRGDGPSWPLYPLDLDDDDESGAVEITALFVPGHSKGHLAFLFDSSITGGDGVLFTGDHLAYSARRHSLGASAQFSWNIDLQADSIAALADLDFLHILPGHGRRVAFADAKDRQTQILRAAHTFRTDPYATNAPPQ